MKILDVIKTGNRNLSRAKLRTFLTISAIFVGAVTLTITTALGAGTQQYIDTQLGNVATPGVFFVTPKVDQENPFAGADDIKEYDPAKNNATFNNIVTLKEKDIDKLKDVQDIDFAKPYYSLKSEFVTVGDKKFNNSNLTQYNGLNIDLTAGRVLKTDDKNSMLLPEKYIAALGFTDAEAAVGRQVTIGYKNVAQAMVEKKFTVQGVLKKSILTDGDTYVDDTSANDIAKDQAQTDNYFAAIVKFKDANDQNEAMYKDRVQGAGEYTATSMKEQIKTITDVVSAITAALNIIGIIALVAASFGIINTLLMSVYERTQEIGLMKALGMHRRTVFGLFAFEAILVGFWGSVAATVGAYFISLGVNQMASETFLKGLDGFTLLLITPANALMVIGVIMLVAFLAGTLPAIKASRLNPIDALRSE